METKFSTAASTTVLLLVLTGGTSAVEYRAQSSVSPDHTIRNGGTITPRFLASSTVSSANAVSHEPPYAHLKLIEEFERDGFEARIPDRLRRLLSEFADETNGDIYSLTSLEGFLQYARANSSDAKPAVIALTDEGELYVTWRGQARETLSLRFLRSGAVRYALSKGVGVGAAVEARSGTSELSLVRAAIGNPAFMRDRA